MSGKNLLKLFDRPTEPVFMPKGDDNTTFEVPTNYLEDRFKPLQSDLTNRFGTGKTVQVKNITLPDLSLPLMLERRANFSLFIPSHRRMAARLVEVFVGMRSLDDFLAAAVYARDRMNPYLFIYALSVAILHRPDTKDLQVPSLIETFPDKYVDGAVFARAREETSIVPEEQRIPLEIPRDYTASDLDIEHRVAYFREDLGINLHHWHWHLVYPFDGPTNIVNKDRRGELFYYMHQQIMARYNVERLCNDLARVRRLTNLREPIPEGYFPKLDSLVSSRVWPPRFANAVLDDVYREVDQIKFDLSDLERWRDRIFSAIHSGTVVDDEGKFVELSETRGIDLLGNILEASILSINRNLYGDLHNLGHVAIALCHDPEAKHLETFSIMGDPATAMRDPIFYRWHAFIDDIFQEHKNTLPRYSVQQLEYPGVRISGLEVVTEGSPKNQLNTFWQQSDINLSRGLDFSPRGAVFARFTHLQHRPFTYRITVENSGNQRMGTVRIFIGPKFDERGLPMLLADQKNLFIELDKFTVNLKSGKNNLTRNSSESSVTIPFETTFRDLNDNRPQQQGGALERFNYCGCGWPQHMLIPKGSPEGYLCQLFVMVSNFNDDRVETQENNRGCKDATSYCGLRDNRYPDKRSMGYPFDRVPRDRADTLAQFLTPNMIVQDVTIRHTNEVRPRNQPGGQQQNQQAQGNTWRS
uniref:Prophenoloxidase n=1 Tax=Riptortus pedestris TaxID=329032 RepID=R4WPL8_RIPPE|nr:prophenoloxidase [Riptortus pedestris]